MLIPIFQYRNIDSTLNLNEQISVLFDMGLVSGGQILPVSPSASPQITIAPFKLIGFDGMVVFETAVTQTLDIPYGQTSYVVFRSVYSPNSEPTIEFNVLSAAAYASDPQIDYLVVFCVVTPSSPTAVVATDINLTTADIIDPVHRIQIRGVLSSFSDLPTSQYVGSLRVGDTYIVEDGTGPATATNGYYVWSGTSFNNYSTSSAIGAILTQHRNNLFANEIHLTNAQAAAAAGSFGSPSALNPYVTSTDPRLPTADESDALVGISQEVPVPPSASNPFVTAAYALAQPSQVSIAANPGVQIPIASGNGPFFVGQAAGSASAAPYFQIYHATEPREFVDSTGAPVSITGVLTSISPPTPLDPATNAGVLATNGFYGGNIWLTYTGTIDLNFRILYGQQNDFETFLRGMLLLAQPSSAQTSQEALERFQDISGYLFDTTVPAAAQNINLLAAIGSFGAYLSGVTASDMVLDSSNFPRLRSIPAYSAEFPLQTGEVSAAVTATAPYTVSVLAAPLTSFDADADVGMEALITYSGVAPSLSGVSYGYIFVDDLGQRFRILELNAPSLLIYTNGRAVNVANASGSNSQILQGNNPFQLEIVDDFQPNLNRELIVIDGTQPIPNEIEFLPPGGMQNGAYVPGSDYYSAIGSALLPNGGNSAGAPSGRPFWYPTPNRQGNLPERRVRLVGNWKSDQTNYPRQAVGQVSLGAVGIDYTGRVSDLILYTSIQPDIPYGFQVFIDGVYNFAASQFLTNLDYMSLVPSTVLSAYRGATEVQLMPLIFPLSLSDSQIHNIRIEITKAGTLPFQLYGIEIFNSGLTEEAGNAFTQADLNQIDTVDQSVTTLPLSTRGTRYSRYVNRTGARAVQTQIVQTVQDASTLVLPMSTTTFTDVALAPNLKVGDVGIFTSNNSLTPVDTANYVFRQVTGLNLTTNQITINSGLPFGITSGNGRFEKAYTIPAQIATGAPILAAPPNLNDVEIARYAPADWTAGPTDILNLVQFPNTLLTRNTTFDDGSSSMTVVNCAYVTTGLEGYTNGIQMSQTNSSMVLNYWCTRMDVVFCGSGGTPTTVEIEIDGAYTYTLTVPCDGLEQHALFFNGAPQTHTVRIMNPSNADAIIVGQWIFYDVATPPVDGAATMDYVVGRNTTAANTNPTPLYDFAYSGTTDPTIVSLAGVRIFNPSKTFARYYEGTGGSTNWEVSSDFTLNPRFGDYVQTDRTSALAEITVVGQHAELYYIAGPDQGIFDVLIDGLTATTANYPNCFGAGGLVGYNASAGTIDGYAASGVSARFVMTNLTAGPHVIRIVNTGTKNGSSAGTFVSIAGMAENPGSGSVVQLEANNRVKFQSFQDDRELLTLLPNQSAPTTGGAAVAATAAPVFSGYTAVVGTASDVTNGDAQYTSLVTALSSVPAGSSILVLGGNTYTGNISITQNVSIEGRGSSTIIDGTFEVTGTANYCSFLNFTVDGNITFDAGSTQNEMDFVWQTTGLTVTDNGTYNQITVFQE